MNNICAEKPSPMRGFKTLTHIKANKQREKTEANNAREREREEEKLELMGLYTCPC